MYIDTAGNFGRAEDLVVFDSKKVAEEDLARLNEILDKGEPTFLWVLEMGERLEREKVLVSQSIYTRSEGADETAKTVLKARFGL
jgi:hypothetical protein